MLSQLSLLQSLLPAFSSLCVSFYPGALWEETVGSFFCLPRHRICSEWLLLMAAMYRNHMSPSLYWYFLAWIQLGHSGRRAAKRICGQQVTSRSFPHTPNIYIYTFLSYKSHQLPIGSVSDHVFALSTKVYSC